MKRVKPTEWIKGPKAWRVLRWALFGAGSSLALYLPYRYAVNPPSLPGIYAFLLPLSSILAMGGMAIALNPGLSFRLNRFTRAGIAALAVLWLAAGMACVPSLAWKIASEPAVGLSAAFQMFVQHVFLSASVGAFALKPVETHAWFGLGSAIAGMENDSISENSFSATC